MKDLTIGSPMKAIFGFALPLFIGHLFQLFYGLADTRIVGSCLGDASLAAVNATTTLDDLIIGFLVGLTNGFAVLTAKYFGAGEPERVRRSFAASLRLGLVVSLLLTVVSLLFLPQILVLLNTPPEHIAEGSAYIGVILGGMTFSMLYNAYAATLRAVGDTVAPLAFLILSAFLNIGLDLLFIEGFKMGVSGAAAATVVSKAISFLACVVYVRVRYPVLRLTKGDFRPERELDRRLIGNGISMGLMNSLVCLGSVILQGAINRFGTATIIAHGAARKITNIFMLPFGIFGMTMATYCSQCYGAGKYARIKKGVFGAMGFCWGWCLLVILASYTVAPALVRLVTDTKLDEAVETAALYLRVDTLFYFLVAIISPVRNAIQGIGDHITPLVSSAVELVGKILAAYLLAPAIGYMGIILTEPLVWAPMVVPLIVRMVKFFKTIPRET
ncbi:MAG: MATE family efflux transporter [Bacteroides sp.]|nr:MATE family efflux transporter [Eubacterium sp.]MCM1419240.1 MATE family efflux transporter [Roseburia sp.]MCM1463086.1 MATE family efflux transporter [Bacteroides sp.]